jgi:hypothetical protein
MLSQRLTVHDLAAGPGGDTAILDGIDPASLHDDNLVPA